MHKLLLNSIELKQEAQALSLLGAMKEDLVSWPAALNMPIAHYAATDGALTLIKKLMHIPGILQLENSRGVTPFIRAAINNQRAIVNYFLLEHIDNFATPTHEQAFWGTCSPLNITPENLQLKDTAGYIPLHYAAAAGQCATFELLLKATPPDLAQYDVLLNFVITNQHHELLHILLPKISVNCLRNTFEALIENIFEEYENPLQLIQTLLSAPHLCSDITLKERIIVDVFAAGYFGLYASLLQAYQHEFLETPEALVEFLKNFIKHDYVYGIELMLDSIDATRKEQLLNNDSIAQILITDIIQYDSKNTYPTLLLHGMHNIHRPRIATHAQQRPKLQYMLELEKQYQAFQSNRMMFMRLIKKILQSSLNDNKITMLSVILKKLDEQSIVLKEPYRNECLKHIWNFLKDYKTYTAVQYNLKNLFPIIVTLFHEPKELIAIEHYIITARIAFILGDYAKAQAKLFYAINYCSKNPLAMDPVKMLHIIISIIAMPFFQALHVEKNLNVNELLFKPIRTQQFDIILGPPILPLLVIKPVTLAQLKNLHQQLAKINIPKLTPLLSSDTEYMHQTQHELLKTTSSFKLMDCWIEDLYDQVVASLHLESVENIVSAVVSQDKNATDVFEHLLLTQIEAYALLGMAWHGMAWHGMEKYLFSCELHQQLPGTAKRFF